MSDPSLASEPRGARVPRSFPPLFLPVVFTAIAGAIGFDVAQRLEGLTPTIPYYMGQAIVRQGGYPEGLATLIGWGVHLGVSLAYTAVFAIGAWAIFGGATKARRLIGSAILGGLLAVGTTLVTAPAIATTIGILSGHGIPDRLPPLNTAWGLPFWNHLLFFGIVWIGSVVLLDRD